MALEKFGSHWFIHYSYQVSGKTHEASIYLTDPGTKYFRYKRMRRAIGDWLNKIHDGDLKVVIRNYFQVSKMEIDNFWAGVPKESCMVEVITLI